MSLYSIVSDPVSDVLSLVSMQAELVGFSCFSAPWGITFGSGYSYLHIMNSGTAWFRLDKIDELIRADAGDLLLFPKGSGHIMSDTPEREPVKLEAIVDKGFDKQSLQLRYGGSGAETHMLCGRFRYTGMQAEQLMNNLPSIIKISPSASTGLDWLETTQRYLMTEIRRQTPGFSAMTTSLLKLLFVQIIREWANSHDQHLGWLSGVRDDRIGKALEAIHENPSHSWTATKLAHIVNMSRSAFASRFVQTVGEAPLTYVRKWRLSLAADLLKTGRSTAGEVAYQIGYNSVGAFNRAFKAEFGTTPAAFKKSRKPCRSRT